MSSDGWSIEIFDEEKETIEELTCPICLMIVRDLWPSDSVIIIC